MELIELLKSDLFFWAAEASKLKRKLFHYLQKRPKLLLKAGVKTSKMSFAEIFSKTFLNPPPPMARTMRDFYVQETAAELEAFLKDHSKEELFELILSTRMANLGLLENVEEQMEVAARLYIASCFCADEEVVAFTTKLQDCLRQTQAKDELNPLVIHSIVQDPSYLQYDKENQDNQLLILLACMIAARFGDLAKANSLKKKFFDKLAGDAKTQGQVRQSLEHYLERSTPEGDIPAKKLRRALPSEVENVNIEELEVLTICKRFISKQYSQADRESSFSEVIAIKRPQSSTWKELSREAADRLFPTRGQIAHFTGRLKPTPPRKRQIGVWRVTPISNLQDSVNENAHEKSLAIAHVMPGFQIRSLDIRSDETERLVDKISEISDVYHLDEDDMDIFRLADGIYIKPERGVRELVDGDFSDHIPAWRQLPAIQLGNGMNISVGRLPDTSFALDLSRSKQIIRKSLEQLLLLSSSERKSFASAISDMTSDPKLFELVEEMQVESLGWQHEGFTKLASRMRRMPEFAKALAANGGGQREAIEQSKSQIKKQISETKSKINILTEKTDKNYKELVRYHKEADELLTTRGLEDLARKIMHRMLRDRENLARSWKLEHEYTENQALKRRLAEMGEQIEESRSNT